MRREAVSVDLGPEVENTFAVVILKPRSGEMSFARRVSVGLVIANRLEPRSGDTTSGLELPEVMPATGYFI